MKKHIMIMTILLPCVVVFGAVGCAEAEAGTKVPLPHEIAAMPRILDHEIICGPVGEFVECATGLFGTCGIGVMSCDPVKKGVYEIGKWGRCYPITSIILEAGEGCENGIDEDCDGMTDAEDLISCEEFPTCE